MYVSQHLKKISWNWILRKRSQFQREKCHIGQEGDSNIGSKDNRSHMTKSASQTMVRKY